MKPVSRYLPAEERRALTVDAVIALAAGQNPGDITTAAIAQHMGLTQGALFRHFPSKDAIFEATMEAVAERLLARVDAAAAAAPTALAALEAMFMAHIDFIARHPGVPRMLFGELQRSDGSLPKKVVQALIRQYDARLRKLLDTGHASGELDAALDMDAAAALFLGSIQGLVMQSLLAGRIEHMRSAAPGVFAIYCRGIGGRQ